MTATKQVTIWCDHFGSHHTDRLWDNFDPDDRCFEWIDHGISRVSEMRKSIRSHGWTYRDGKDLCPRHSDKQEG